LLRFGAAPPACSGRDAEAFALTSGDTRLRSDAEAVRADAVAIDRPGVGGRPGELVAAMLECKPPF